MKKLPNNHGFKIPEGYLESFEKDLQERLHTEDIPKDTGFTVPDGYFESFDFSFSEKSNSKERKTTKVISIFRQNKLWVAAAAACIVLLLVFTPTSDTDTIDSLDLSAIDNYIEDGNLDLDYYDVTAIMDDDMLSAFNTSQIIDEDIEAYLLENLNDNTLLIE